MVKMAYAPLPKLACKPVGTSRMCPKNVKKSTLSDILQSDPVKRLFNQPNIIIKTIPLSLQASSASNKNILIDKKNGLNTEVNRVKRPEVSIVPLTIQNEQTKEDADLLPSKIEGKSEIALLPIKREKKVCGHYEPCENIVCDVAVQQYVDRNGVSPMLATHIEEDEINAPVAKHCKNEKCDALSIDHNRCRRALIKLNRCDQSDACDICGITLKTRKSRVHHRNCTRKDEYRHNEANGAQVLKERMRERELQLMEALKTKKNDYLDPINGHSLAMETLRNNEELIIIPKTVSVHQPSIAITTVSTSQPTQQMNNVKSVFGKLLPSLPIVLPQQNVVLGKKSASNENSSSLPKQVKFSDVQNKPLVTTSNSVPLPQNQYIRLAGTQQNNVQPIAINDWLLSQPQVVTTTQIQPKQFLTPIRVVPITNLITQPSLLHQTQGIPKFCIMADNVISPVTAPNQQSAQSSAPVPNTSVQSEPKVPLQKKKKTPIKKSLKRKFKKKDFRCSFCLKRFSTHWYFKMHVAMHKGEKRFSCKICTETFSNRYDMKKHMTNDHKNENIPCDMCDHICTSYVSFEKHTKAHSAGRSYKCADCDIAYTSATHLKFHRRKFHGKVECKYCQEEFSKDELNHHIVSEHDMSKESIKENEEKNKNRNSLDELTEMEVPEDAAAVENTTVDSTLKQMLGNKQEADESDSKKRNVRLFIPTEKNVKDTKIELNHRV